MKAAHIDAYSGASGDMFLAALIDAGVVMADLETVLRGLPIDGWTLDAEPVTRQGLAGTEIRVHAPEDGVVRTWGNVRSLLAAANLPEPVRARALGTFARMAAAEAHIHRIAVDRTHFHEVGAIDAIIDVVGVCAAFHLLGVERATCGPVAMGTGMARTAHGFSPIPAPVVVELMRGAPTFSTEITSELCTPVGAALLAEWVEDWGPQPEMTVERIGYGAGTRELERPNVLRVTVGEVTRTAGSGQMLVLETTVDDLSGELLPPVLEALRASGATDAWARPVLMKRGRPGQEIICVSDPWHGDTLRGVLFRETTTVTIRGYLVEQWQLKREWATVDVAGHEVRLKIGRLGDDVVNVAPEYEDCAAAAAASGLPLKEVFARARAAWAAQQDRDMPPPDPYAS